MGQVHEHSIFSESGQKLIGPGVELTERHIQALRRCINGDVIVAESLDDLARDGLLQSVDRAKLRVGQRAHRDLITTNGKMLLEAGENIEQHHLDALEASGDPYLGQDRPTTDRRERILMAEVLVEQLEAQLSTMKLRVEASEDADWITPANPEEWPAVEELADFRAQAVEKLRRTFAKIEAGAPVDAGVFEKILDDLMDRLSHHPTRFPQLALLCRRTGEYMADHAYTAAVLAMAIAAQMRWPREHVRTVGFAGLVYDLGMLLLPERIRSGACELTEMDRQRVNRHPIFGLAMLEAVPDVPRIVRLAAMQHQERENGSGYPFGKRKASICDYARVIAAADAYAATTEPRHYRQPKLPYAAMEETLRFAAAQVFWPPAVRALVSAVGLFPVGSYVKLSNGRLAHVLACHPEQVDRPMIQPVTPEGDAMDEPIDLKAVHKDELSIVRPIPAP